MGLYQGDCLDVLAGLDAACVSSVVTDPPYGLAFMGKAWDAFAPAAAARAGRKARKDTDMPAGSGPLNANGFVEYDYSARGLRGYQDWCEAWGRACLRVMKPGAYLVASGSPRTYHRMVSGLEDAGFVIRDCLQWLYGSGFPKSHNLHGGWDGWGTALKPAYEPIVLAQKPRGGTYAANVQAWGVGGLNIDGCRISTDGEILHAPQSDPGKRKGVVGGDLGFSDNDLATFRAAQAASIARTNALGRWPANVLLGCACAGNDHDAECAVALLDAQSGERKAGGYVSGLQPSKTGDNGIYGTFERIENRPYGDTGGASRFFYCAKASRSERGAGTSHPTVKPLALMRYLVRLVTPPGGVCLDPFAGSGTTLVACVEEGREWIGVEHEAAYCAQIRGRLAGVPIGRLAGV